MAKGEKAPTIGHTEFPLYCVETLGERHFLVAGGGGASKTGVSNAFDVFELKLSDGQVIADKVLHYETGSSAAMNCAVGRNGQNFTLALGLDESVQMYDMKYKVVKRNEHQPIENKEGIRKRKGNLTSSEDHKAAPTMVTFDVEPKVKVKTDFSDTSAFQKACRFRADLSQLVTGGTDGRLRVWKCPDLTKSIDIKGHAKEVDDLDINFDGTQVASVCQEEAVLWNTKDGKRVSNLVWSFKTAVKYKFRNCRFGIVSDKKSERKYHLYTSHIPAVREKKAKPCYLTKWDCKTYKPLRVQATGDEILSTLAASDDGLYLGVGTISGSVSVYISFSLQKLYHVKEAHKIFVTGLTFTPSNSRTVAVTGDQDFTLLSISADNQIKLHQESPRTLWSPLWAVAGMIIFIYLLFWFISSLGL